MRTGRIVSRSGSVILCAIALCCGIQAEASTANKGSAISEWPMRGQGPHHRGCQVTVEGPSQLDQKPEIVLRTEGRIVAQVVTDAKGDLYFGSGDGFVYALRLHSGPEITDETTGENDRYSLKWKFKTERAVVSTGALSGQGTLFVGSWDHHLYAIDTADGTMRWKVNLGYVVSSSPVLSSDGTLYVGSGDGNLYGISSTGTVLWTFKAGDSIFSSPAMSADGTKVYFGSWDAKIYCLDAFTGVALWSHETGGAVDSSPALSPNGDIVYVGSWDGHVYALDTSSGRLRWKYRTGDEGVVASPAVRADGIVVVGCWNRKIHAIDPDSGAALWAVDVANIVEGSAAIDGEGNVFVGIWGGVFLSLRGTDGALMWTATLSDRSVAVSSGATILRDGSVVFGADDGVVRRVSRIARSRGRDVARATSSMAPPVGDDALVEVEVDADGRARRRETIATRPETTATPYAWSEFRGGHARGYRGKSQLPGPVPREADGTTLGASWTLTRGSAFSSSPVIDSAGRRAFVGNTDGFLYAVELASGRVIWRAETNGGIVSTPALWNDRALYVGSWDNHLYAIDTSSGATLWKYPTSDAVSSSPTIHPTTGDVYFGSGDGHMYAVARETGRLVWKRKTEGAVYGSSSLSPDGTTVFFGSWDAYLYALDAKSGDVRWRAKTGGKIDASPLHDPMSGIVVCGSWDGYVFGVDATTGELRWNVSSDGNTAGSERGGGVVGSPALGHVGTQDAVFVGTWDSKILALSPKDGRVLWSVDVDSEIESSITIDADGFLFVGSTRGTIYVIRSLDGTIVASTTLASGMLDDIAISSTVAIGDQRSAIVGLSNGKLLSLRVARRNLCPESVCPRAMFSMNPSHTGVSAFVAPRLVTETSVAAWTFKGPNMREQVVSTPAVGPDGVVYVGTTTGHLRALNVAGQPLWTSKVGGLIFSSPLIGADGTIYVGSWDQHMYAFRSSDGLEKWRIRTLGAVSSSVAMAPGDVSGTLYVGSGDGHVYAISNSGSVLWKRNLGSAIYGSPAIDDTGETLYIGTYSGEVVAIRLRAPYVSGEEGEVIWTTRLGEDRNVESSPMIGTDGTIYVADLSGHVTAVSKN
eukprot:g3540.t1